MRGHFKAAAPAPALPSSLTSYDILKSLAVIIMIIDHIGYYFYPDDDWLRAVGRIGFPVWFFLIGYARSRRIDYHLIAGAFILLAADVAFSRSLLPVNALFTMIILRVCLDPLMRLVKDNDITLIILTAVLYILFPLTNLYWEYGTLAMLFAICGYLARNGFNKKGYAFMP